MDEVLLQIARGCLSLEEMAQMTYSCIAKESSSDDLRQFFEQMSRDESDHIEFWKQVYLLVESGAMADIVDKEQELLDDIRKTIEVVERIRDRIKNTEDARKVFILAFYFETYIMRPAFGLIFQFVKNISDIKNPIDTYQIHLQRFINQFKRQDINDIELESVANIIFQLYNENIRLSALSYVDMLSGLLNRRGLFSSIYTLTHIIHRSGGSAGMIMLDIDNFKKRNDEYGHQIGDQIISSVGTIVKSCIRNSDIAGRYGGEEFLIFLPNVREDMLLKIAENIRVKIKTEFLSRYPITVSAGCSFFKKIKDPERDIERMLKMADENLYISKKEGKDRVTYRLS